MVGCTEAGSLNWPQPSFFLSQKNCETGYRPASQCCLDFPLVDSNASIQQVAAVAVAIGERDAKQSWRGQRAVGSYDRECYRAPIVGPSPGEGHGVRNLVKGRGRDLGRLKVYARAGIAEGRAASCLVGIVVIEAELGLPAMLAVYVNISSFFIASPRAVA